MAKGRLILVFLTILCFYTCTAGASEIWVNARFGGSVGESTSTMLSSFRRGGVGGGYVVAVEAFGPEFLHGLQPFISYDHLWSGNGGSSLISTKFNAFSFGLGRSYKLGYAEATIMGGVAYHRDIYDVWPAPGDSESLTLSSWGATTGFNIRFLFFENIDSLIGYRALFREKQYLSAVSTGGIQYDLEGTGISHCFTFGFGIRFGSSL